MTNAPTTPTEIDTQLADALERLARIDAQLAQYANLLDDPRNNHSTQRCSWSRSWEALTDERPGVQDEVDALNRLYTGWSRFFLVRNNGGHIHSTMTCSTCYPTTVFGWLPTVSGKSEAEAVAEFGSVLCTICYPTAPSEWTGGELREVVEAREAKAAAKAEREAKKAAKAIGPITVPHDTLRTLTAATRWLTDAAEWNRYSRNHPSFPAEAVAEVAAAVAAKTGDSVEDVLAAAEKRAAKR